MNEKLLKIAFWLGILISAEQAIGQGTVSLTHVVPASWIPYVQAWCTFLAFMGGLVMTALTGKAMVSSPFSLSSAPKAAAAALLVASAIGMALMSAPAFAAQKRPILTGDPIKDIKNAVQRTDASDGVQLGGGNPLDPLALRKQLLQTLAKPFQDLVTIMGNDVDTAIAESTTIPAIQDGHGQQCWIGLRNFSGVAKAHPLPLSGQAATDLEAIRLYAIATNQLCGNPHCLQMFSDFQSMAQALGSAIAGPLGSQAAKLNVPSMQDICSKVPQIALVAPVTVPAQAAVTAVEISGAPAAVPASPAGGVAPASSAP
jgi:hypothetical protein